jgi:hypothetical protein
MASDERSRKHTIKICTRQYEKITKLNTRRRRGWPSKRAAVARLAKTRRNSLGLELGVGWHKTIEKGAGEGARKAPPRTCKRERDGKKQVWTCLDFRRDETENTNKWRSGANFQITTPSWTYIQLIIENNKTNNCKGLGLRRAIPHVF